MSAVAFREMLFRRQILTSTPVEVFGKVLRTLFGLWEFSAEQLDVFMNTAPPYRVQLKQIEADAPANGDVLFQVYGRVVFGATDLEVSSFTVSIFKPADSIVVVFLDDLRIDQGHYGKEIAFQLLRSLLHWTRERMFPYFAMEAMGLGLWTLAFMGFTYPVHLSFLYEALRFRKLVTTELPKYLVKAYAPYGLTEFAAQSIAEQSKDLPDIARMALQLPKNPQPIYAGQDFFVSLLLHMERRGAVVGIPMNPEDASYQSVLRFMNLDSYVRG